MPVQKVESLLWAGRDVQLAARVQITENLLNQAGLGWRILHQKNINAPWGITLNRTGLFHRASLRRVRCAQLDLSTVEDTNEFRIVSLDLHACSTIYVIINVYPMRALVLFLCALPLPAGEYAVLTNGFRVHADRHERRGSFVRLESERGVTELPVDSIVAFEAEEYVAPQPPPVVPEPPKVEQSAPVPRPRTTHELVESAAQKAELPPAIVHAVARAESGYRQNAISPKGAIGVMQLMPGTAKDLNADPYDPEQNTRAGAQYLRDMLVRYDGDVAKALAAYNAGPGAVDKYGAVPPYRETRAYVNRVIGTYKKLGGE